MSEVVRNYLDCRVKPDNDKEDVGFLLKQESNISGNVIPAKASAFRPSLQAEARVERSTELTPKSHTEVPRAGIQT